MHGPMRWIRSAEIAQYKNQGPIYEWADGPAYLMIDRVAYGHKAGAILCYHNPPVHQIGTAGLYAFHDGMDVVFNKKAELEFLILCSANAPVHSGGDLKESLIKLQATLKRKRELEASGASGSMWAQPYSWKPR